MWSACVWVKRIASTRWMWFASACVRRSVDVSTRIDRTLRANGVSAPLSSSIRIDGRVRRSRGSAERQTAQSQPIAGTPCDVPLPRTVTRISGFDDPLLAAGGLDEPHAELEEDLLEELPLFGREVAARLLLEQ